MTNTHRSLIEALVKGDMERFVLLGPQLSKDENTKANQLLGALFYLAVNRRWNSQTDSGEIRQFVADLRSAMEVEQGDIDPLAAEGLIFSALTGDTAIMESLAPNTIVHLETVIAFRIVSGLGLGESEKNQLLDEAQALAAEWAMA